MGLGVVVVVALIITGLGGYVAVDNGYVPIKDLAGISFLTTLHEIAPPGNYTSISVEQVKAKYPAITEKIATQMPHYNDILIRLYSTGANASDVAEFYRTTLAAKGYTCIKSGRMDIGNVDQGVISIYYYGYEKGITAVGVVMSDNIPGATLVLYTTGYSSYFGDIIPWLEQQKVSTG
jgi:hypothetical protein